MPPKRAAVKKQKNSWHVPITYDEKKHRFKYPTIPSETIDFSKTVKNESVTYSIGDIVEVRVEGGGHEPALIGYIKGGMVLLIWLYATKRRENESRENLVGTDTATKFELIISNNGSWASPGSLRRKSECPWERVCTSKVLLDHASDIAEWHTGYFKDLADKIEEKNQSSAIPEGGVSPNGQPPNEHNPEPGTETNYGDVPTPQGLGPAATIEGPAVNGDSDTNNIEMPDAGGDVLCDASAPATKFTLTKDREISAGRETRSYKKRGVSSTSEDGGAVEKPKKAPRSSISLPLQVSLHEQPPSLHAPDSGTQLQAPTETVINPSVPGGTGEPNPASSEKNFQQSQNNCIANNGVMPAMPALTPGSAANGVSGIIPTLQNIVATVNLDCRLDLKTIALHARNADEHKSEPTSLTCASQDGSKQLLSSNSCQVLVDRSHCNVGFNFFANETSRMEDDQFFLMQDVYHDDYGSDHIDGDGY